MRMTKIEKEQTVKTEHPRKRPNYISHSLQGLAARYVTVSSRWYLASIGSNSISTFLLAVASNIASRGRRNGSNDPRYALGRTMWLKSSRQRPKHHPMQQLKYRLIEQLLNRLRMRSSNTSWSERLTNFSCVVRMRKSSPRLRTDSAYRGVMNFGNRFCLMRKNLIV